jgi:septal ring factor EnvC (AmiA/AmiB activator)
MLGKKSADYVPPAALPGRNDPCHCGSGKKYKKCCEEKDASAQHTILEKQWTEAEKIAAKKAEEEKAAAQRASLAEGRAAQPEQANAPTKPTHQPHVSEHRRNNVTIPKFGMPRKTGGG